jgi:hypothetical protein
VLKVYKAFKVLMGQEVMMDQIVDVGFLIAVIQPLLIQEAMLL